MQYTYKKILTFVKIPYSFNTLTIALAKFSPECGPSR